MPRLIEAEVQRESVREACRRGIASRRGLGRNILVGYGARGNWATIRRIRDELILFGEVVPPPGLWPPGVAPPPIRPRAARAIARLPRTAGDESTTAARDLRELLAKERRLTADATALRAATAAASAALARAGRLPASGGEWHAAVREAAARLAGPA